MVLGRAAKGVGSAEAEGEIGDTQEGEEISEEPQSLQLHPLLSHSTHYHPPIPSLLKVFDQPIRGAEYKMEDFLDLGYGPLLDTAFGVVAEKKEKRKDNEDSDDGGENMKKSWKKAKRRKITKEPAVRDSALDGPGDVDVVRDLWGFGVTTA